MAMRGADYPSITLHIMVVAVDLRSARIDPSRGSPLH